MKNIIMGTAGHIDHGKTALIKLLTGIDCDTHPEEKARGITINLGFSHLEMDKLSIGIIDVPGHKDFIHTMVSGAFGIDMVLLVISAESGVMPQTVEHLRIMQLLGIKHGLVALTKADLVDSETLQLAHSEITDFLKGTFLEESQIVAVSSKTGWGLSELKEAIKKKASSCSEKNASGFFRMFIDRIFTVKGYGTVATGTSLGGRISCEDTLYLLPPGKKLRARRIEKHGESLESVTAGSRVSLNLAGMDKSEYKRGMVISEMIIKPSGIIDAKMSMINKVKFSAPWLNSVFLSGTFTSEARIHLLDKEKLEESGEEALVQIHLKEPAVLLRGDKFILRNTSDEATIGGGEVIDSYPLHHRRRTEKLIRDLKRLSDGGTGDFVLHELNKNRLLLPFSYFSDILPEGEEQLSREIRREHPGEVLLIEKSGRQYLLNREKVNYFEKKILQALESYHCRNPLDECGRKKEELLHLCKDYESTQRTVFLDVILESLLKAGLIKLEQNTFVLARHKIELKDSVKREIEFVENLYRRYCMRLPVESEVISEAEKFGIAPEKYRQIMNLLISKKKLTFISGSYIYSETVESCRAALLNHLDCTGRSVTVAQFRDLVKGNRKMCILLLNYFDSEGLTLREGDYRTITEKGKMFLLKIPAEK